MMKSTVQKNFVRVLMTRGGAESIDNLEKEVEENYFRGRITIHAVVCLLVYLHSVSGWSTTVTALCCTYAQLPRYTHHPQTRSLLHEF